MLFRSHLLMENKRFLTAQDVMEMLDVSLSYAYKLIRRLNAELETEGFVTIKGRVSTQYFMESKAWFGKKMDFFFYTNVWNKVSSYGQGMNLRCRQSPVSSFAGSWKD